MIERRVEHPWPARVKRRYTWRHIVVFFFFLFLRVFEDRGRVCLVFDGEVRIGGAARLPSASSCGGDENQREEEEEHEKPWQWRSEERDTRSGAVSFELVVVVMFF